MRIDARVMSEGKYLGRPHYLLELAYSLFDCDELQIVDTLFKPHYIYLASHFLFSGAFRLVALFDEVDWRLVVHVFFLLFLA